MMPGAPEGLSATKMEEYQGKVVLSYMKSMLAMGSNICDHRARLLYDKWTCKAEEDNHDN
jgi:hypothetical protein